MSRATVDGNTRPRLETSSPSSVSLFDLLHNTLVLRNTVPHLPVASLLHLAAADRAFRALLYATPGVFRYLDLTRVKAARWDVDEIDGGRSAWRHHGENLTEDGVYSAPLRGIFSTLGRRQILRHVQTLVLDGLSVTSELCHDIINDATFRVRILSVRDVKNLNQAKLRAALQYACRPSRPADGPSLQALYVFGAKEAPPPWPPTVEAASVGSGWNRKSQMALERQADPWWAAKGRVVARSVSDEWAHCMAACEGIVAFDAVLCRGPRHGPSPRWNAGPAVATFAVAACERCGDCPEGLLDARASPPSSLPLLAPPPLLSSSVRAATAPHLPCEPMVARCADCLRERYCAGCHTWWCETCYPLPGVGGALAAAAVDVDDVVVFEEEDQEDDIVSVAASEQLEEFAATIKIKSRLSKSCWECGNNCDSCIDRTQRVCRKCCAGYCIIHNEGSTATHCDWCVSRGRGLGRL
ncbi:hypothetical protein RJ55_07511 [Drechmeria coniospora]|nr:hypothetical protein RJ55_07511 [Drechmeria coniospora]